MGGVYVASGGLADRRGNAMCTRATLSEQEEEEEEAENTREPTRAHAAQLHWLRLNDGAIGVRQHASRVAKSQPL